VRCFIVSEPGYGGSIIMKIIVMGCGSMGAGLASALDAEGHNVTVIDASENQLNKLAANFSGTALVGDGTDEEVLKKAGIEKADAFVASTREDERNAMAAQIAKKVFGIPRVVCRIYDTQKGEFYESLELAAVSPIAVFVDSVKQRLGV
jgi:trk system potassium uptake protein